jgi:hypothetical protein
MRTHQQIIADADGPTAMARKIGLQNAGSVYQWKRNDSIPAGYWAAIADAHIATLKELAEAADARRDHSKHPKPHAGPSA